MSSMRWVAALLVVILLGLLPAGAQMRVRPVADQRGHVGLGLMLRRLNVVGTFMMATAHPDDENNALLAMLSHGQGIRTTLVTATRGDGGQNEIGPELFDALAMLRTEELLAAHRFDGAEQYFTRAVDFGYSFSLEETFERWGREEILGDFVRMIRTIRPDVVAGLSPTGGGGGQHHQASAILAQEAFHAAADPERFSDQLEEGLRPWQAKKFYFSGGFGRRGPGGPASDPRAVSIDLTGFDPLLGRTYASLGSEARSMHKCQGMPQLLRLPGQSEARYILADTVLEGQAEETSLFDGLDPSITGLARYAGARAPRELALGLERVERQARGALSGFESEGAIGALPPLFEGLSTVRNLRGQLGSMGLTDDAVFEIDFRLAAKERQFEQAVVLASGLEAMAFGDDGLVTPGQDVRVTAIVANGGRDDVVVRRIDFAGFEGTGLGCGTDVVTAGEAYTCSTTLGVPDTAIPTTTYFRRLEDADRYEFDGDAPFGLPFRPTPFVATSRIEFAGERVDVEVPVLHRYEHEIFSGEKRRELKVVPDYAVSLSPEIAVVSTSASPRQRAREVRVTVVNHRVEPGAGEVRLEVPRGWVVAPVERALEFLRPDEARTVRFSVTPPAGESAGAYEMSARFVTGEADFATGYQVVEYPHTSTRHLVQPARATLKLVDVATTPGLSVGYVMGSGDHVPSALEQLGAQVSMIGADELAWGDLGRYDVIVTGIRAYELRSDLRANNTRLIDYVGRGGTLIVQYNKMPFNDAQYGPYPAQVGRGRITDEGADVRILEPAHPALSFPNRIDEGTWAGWVQERGLYFLGERDPQYVDLVELEDPFANNPGVKRGALVEAEVGSGRWIYVGLGLWRQVLAGTDGAYQLLSNLISLGNE